jgi:predicted enzyme related to lactoylglutathione lyase
MSLRMNITQVQTLTVPVADQDRAKDFYVDTLGLELVADNQAGPMRWLQVAPDGAATGLVLGALPHYEPGSLQGVILTTGDIDGDCERLRKAGVAVDGPHTQPWGTQATFTDPDGNGFVLMGA